MPIWHKCAVSLHRTPLRGAPRPVPIRGNARPVVRSSYLVAAPGRTYPTNGPGGERGARGSRRAESFGDLIVTTD